VAALLDRGDQVRVLDALLPPVHPDRRFPAHLLARGVEWVDGDVRDRSAWERALDEIDAIFHFAAYQDYLPDFSTFFATNTVSTALLYELLVARGQRPHRVVVASSQAVYGEGAYRCPRCPDQGTLRPGPRSRGQLERRVWDLLCPRCRGRLEPVWTDESVATPHNAYAMSKYGQERVALTLGERYEIPTVALRYSIVQGCRQSFFNSYSGVLRIFAQRILNGRQPICYEDGQQLRDYVSVHDVVRANLLVLDDSRAAGEVFNVGSGRRITVAEYAQLVARCANKAISTQIPGVYRVGDTRHVLSSIDRIGALGWRPRVSLVDIVREYLNWAMEEPDFADRTDDADLRMRQLGTLRSARES
jgi:dTDP-L-rhamnose 4-epimerase